MELCESHGKAHAFVLNHAQPGKLTKSSMDFLRQNGSTVIETNKLAKGFVRTSWIESNSRLFMASACSGYKLSLGADGLTNVADICVGTAVGDETYYLNRPRATNDLHGLGAFILMFEQMNK